MLDLYEEFASQTEREDAVMLEQAEIQMDRAILALDTCSAMKDLAMREAECKLVMESGDACDLIEYYEEATEETKDKEKGLFQRAWEAICKFIENIKEKLFGKVKAAPGTKQDVDESFLERHKILGKVVAGIKNYFAHPVRAILSLIAAGGVVVLFTNIVKKGKKKTIGADTTNAVIADSEKALDEINTGIKGFLGGLFKKKEVSEDGNQKKASGLISKVTKCIREIIDEAKNAILLHKADRKAKRNYKDTEGMSPEDYEARKVHQDQAGAAQSQAAADMLRAHQNGYVNGESVEDDDLSGDMYSEDAGALSDIAELLPTL